MRFFIVWMKYPAMARMMNRTMMMTAMAMFSFILSFSFCMFCVVIGFFQNGRIMCRKDVVSTVPTEMKRGGFCCGGGGGGGGDASIDPS